MKEGIPLPLPKPRNQLFSAARDALPGQEEMRVADAVRELRREGYDAKYIQGELDDALDRIQDADLGEREDDVEDALVSVMFRFYGWCSPGCRI